MDSMNGIIVLLGAPNDNSGNLSSIAIERCEQAIREYKENSGYCILPTGGFGEHFNSTEKPHGYYSSGYLKSKGVSKKDILEIIESRNTIEDASLSKKVISRYSVLNLIIVTSDFHRDRAEYLFRKEFSSMKLRMSCCQSELPEEELNKKCQHERSALIRLKNGS